MVFLVIVVVVDMDFIRFVAMEIITESAYHASSLKKRPFCLAAADIGLKG